MKVKLIMLMFFLQHLNLVQAVTREPENLIVGKWMSTQKNLIVEVYRENKEFKAKVIWFHDKNVLARPIATRTDHRNPDETLRSRKLLGMDILQDLQYNPDSNRWEDGLIYDPLSGREWSSVAYINDHGQLNVKGYWHFEFISKTLTFDRLSK